MVNERNTTVLKGIMEFKQNNGNGTGGAKLVKSSEFVGVNNMKCSMAMLRKFI